MLTKISNDFLLDSYKYALKFKADEQFIKLLENELKRRKMKIPQIKCIKAS